MDTWEFFEDDAGRWRWRHIGRMLPQPDSESANGFVSRNDCIADAMHHGYLSDCTVAGARREFMPYR